MKACWEWIKSLFTTRYRITVSFNTQYGDSDDRVYIVKKLLVSKEKHLKFRDEHGKIIEYKSSVGLNYIVEGYIMQQFFIAIILVLGIGC